MGVYLPGTRLPSTYQEVEYIESSGTQYIDTGWYPSSNYAKVVAQIEPTLSGQQREVFYGMTNGSNHYSLHTNKDTLKWYINVGGSANIMTDIAFSSGTKVNTEFEANNGAYSVKVNSSTYSGTYSGTVVQSTRNMYIFAYNENGNITWKQNMKLYSFKVYSAAATLARDLVPCYRKSDGVIGMYDLVNDVFYTNSGTGTFAKGNNINELKNAYIGYARQPGENTVAYYPFKTDRNDYSGNGYNVTNTYSTTIADFNGVNCLNFNNSMCQVGTIDTLTSYSNYTMIARFYCISPAATNIFFKEGGSWGGSGFSTGDPSWNQIRWGNTTNTYSQITSPISGTWVLCGVTALNGVGSFYINGVKTIYKSSGVIAPNHNTTPLSIGGNETGTASSSGYLSELIIEKKGWTDQEVLDYYNKTKANYGL